MSRNSHSTRTLNLSPLPVKSMSVYERRYVSWSVKMMSRIPDCAQPSLGTEGRERLFSVRTRTKPDDREESRETPHAIC